ncbi:pinin/SDK/memA domain protein [Diplocarpon rosae]|nr:pinin/SDK/memA domain protein [Diplocarpon rosae]
MTGVKGPIASAVVLPEAAAPKAASKRRQSSASDSTPKRLRQSLDANSHSSTALREPSESSKKEPESKLEDGVKDRQKSSVVEEKKRGQRLFGGLLSTLSQSTPNGQQKRRLEIEKRQSERAKQQKDSDEAHRRERLADFKKVRQAEQIKYKEAEMRTRHSNLLSMAHFLGTESAPRIYYAPWKLLPRDEERIKTQITEAQATIEREISQFDLRYPDRPGRKETKAEKADTMSKETTGEPLIESPSVSKVDDTTNPPETKTPQSEQKKEEPQVQEEHNGEVVVENDEDTVIY